MRIWTSPSFRSWPKNNCDSHAINLYLAQVLDLMGKDAEENYQITDVLMAFEDFRKSI